MKEYGRKISMIFLIVLASVIFLSSCGFPTYVLFKGLKLKSDTENTFYISTTETSKQLLTDYVLPKDESGVGGIGLVLLYTVSTDDDTTLVNNTVGYLSSYFKTEEQGVVSFNCNSDTGLVFQTTDKIDVYAMKCAKVTNFESAYSYCANLSGVLDGTLNKITVKDSSIIINKPDYQEEKSLLTKIVWPTIDEDEVKSINLFGAIVVQSTDNRFNNIYWTDFIYLGKLSNTTN